MFSEDRSSNSVTEHFHWLEEVVKRLCYRRQDQCTNSGGYGLPIVNKNLFAEIDSYIQHSKKDQRVIGVIFKSLCYSKLIYTTTFFGNWSIRNQISLLRHISVRLVMDWSIQVSTSRNSLSSESMMDVMHSYPLSHTQ